MTVFFFLMAYTIGWPFHWQHSKGPKLSEYFSQLLLSPIMHKGHAKKKPWTSSHEMGHSFTQKSPFWWVGAKNIFIFPSPSPSLSSLHLARSFCTSVVLHSSILFLCNSQQNRLWPLRQQVHGTSFAQNIRGVTCCHTYEQFNRKAKIVGK